MPNNLNQLIEESIKEFETNYLCEWRWVREQSSRPSGGDFLRSKLQEIAQATEEALRVEERPKEYFGNDLTLGFNQAVSVQEKKIKEFFEV